MPNNQKLIRVLILLRNNVYILILIISYIIVRSAFWDCPPIWDGRVCYSSLLKAKSAPFDILNYSDPDGHVAQGFMLLIGIPSSLLGRNYYLFNIWLTLFGTVSIFAFHQLLTFFTRDYLHKLEIVLITSLFAFHPSVLASMIHFCFDIGIITFFLTLFLCLLRGYLLTAAIISVLLLFTKETSFLLLPIPFLFCYFLQPPYFRFEWIKQHAWIPMLAYSVLTCFLFYKSIFRGVPALWVNYNATSPMETLFGYFDNFAMLQNFYSMIYIINYTWLLSLLWLGLLVYIFYYNSNSIDSSCMNTSFLFFIVFMLTTLILTLVRPFSNVRYVVVSLPLMLLGFAYMLSRVITSIAIRITLISCLLILFLWENIRTVDPISRIYFSTFAFGNHQILAMTKRTGEPSGFGRDQLVYNLEYLKLPQLLNCAMADIRPTTNTVFVTCDREAYWSLFENIDSSTFKATYQMKQVINLQFKSVRELLDLPQRPSEVIFVDLPNWSSANAIGILSQHYSKKVSKIYNIDGYKIEMTHFRIKNTL